MHDLLTDLEFVELKYKKNKQTRGCLEVKLIAHNAGDYKFCRRILLLAQ